MKSNNFSDSLLKEIGSNLKKFRNYMGFFQNEIAENICDRVTLSKIENGLQKNPSVNVLVELCEKLGVNFEYILTLSNNQIKDFSADKEEHIYSLINIGKYNEVEEYLNKNININRSNLEYKLYYYVKGTKAFYENDLQLSLNLFEAGLRNIKSNKGLSLIDILLNNGKLVVIFNNHATKIVKNLEIESILEKQLESIRFLLDYNKKIMTRMLINAADCYRCMGNFKKCEDLILEAENIIKLNNFFELKIDLNFAKATLFYCINEKDKIIDILEESYKLLDIYELKEMKEMYQNKVNLIKELLLQHT